MSVPEPELSVVLLAPERAAALDRTLEHLAAQGLGDRLEAVVVTTPAVQDAPRDHGVPVRLAQVASMASLGPAYALGVRTARAPIVALGEDHAYPQPGWAQALLAAHADERVGAVGAVMVNANPEQPLSWANLLVAYGAWSEPAPGGEMDALPGANVSYRRDVLLGFGAELDALMERGGALHDRLRAAGLKLVLAPGARVRHENVARLRPTAVLRFNAGRLYAGNRVSQSGWSTARRALYAAGSPAIPALRFVRILRDLRARRHPLGPAVLSSLAAGLVLDGAGQAAGFLRGPADAVTRLAAFEFRRELLR